MFQTSVDVGDGSVQVQNDDYKLLKFDAFVTGLVNLPDCQVAEVYSLESDSWKSIETITHDHMLKYIPFASVSAGVLVNGIYHWLAERKIGNEELPEDFVLSYEDFIVSFDFCEERFKQMHLPKAFQDISTYYRPLCTVGVLEDCLCVVSCVRYTCFELEIWVMQDYGVQECWTKRFVIRQEDLSRQLRDLSVTWSFKDEKILFNDKILFKKRESHDQMLYLYDPKLDNGTTTKIRSSPAVILGAQNYIESLVSPNSGTYAGSCTEYDNILCASRTERLRLYQYYKV
ncbi:F-box/kelch-repeat protein At3g06240-like [Papaver somniferum]|uniref:F-box/kelch-repeat protein At3g06240-like n=1 Tax=Papaver somniferum TaxID=3469 RepID=UPI000E6F8AE6|nr:F-box/kelch-repeat protein At3g06240-like [Papaver somniferum]